MRMIQTIATFLLVLAGSLAVIIWYINSLDNRALVERLLGGASGFAVSIEGSMRFGLSPLPSVVAEDVSVANPPWVDRPSLVHAERVEVGLDLWSLVSGPVRIDSMVIHNGRIHLETNAAGQANWIAARGDLAQGEQVSVPDIRRLVFRDTQVVYQRAATGQTYEVRIPDAIAALPVDGPLVATIRGVFRGTSFDAIIQGGRLTRLINDDTRWPIRATVEAVGATVDVKGIIERPLTSQTLDVEATVAGDRLDQWERLVGLWLPPVAPYEATFQLTGDYGRYQLSNIASRFAGSDVTGSLDIDLTAARPSVEGQLDFGFLRLLDLFGIPPRPRLERAANDGRLFDPTVVPFETTHSADARVAATADRFEAWPMLMTDVRTDLVIDDGLMVLEPFHAEMGGGRLDLKIAVDGPAPGSGGSALAAVEGQVEGVRMEQLLPALGLSLPPEGALNLVLNLEGQGNSLRAMMATANGQIDLSVGPGSLPIWGFDLIATDLIQAMMPWARHGDRTPLNCMVGRFSFKDGLAQTHALLIDTTRITVAGAGAINLASEEIDFFFRPRPKDPSLLSVAAPVRISGTLLDYQTRPDAMDLAAKGAATLLLGTLNPVAVIVPFLDVGTGVENPCLNAMQPGSFVTAQPLRRGPLRQAVDFLGSSIGRLFDLFSYN